MKTSKHRILAFLTAMTVIPASLMAQQERFDALANSPTLENRPTEASSKQLLDELLFQRASQTYLWAMPLINTFLRGFHQDAADLIPGIQTLEGTRVYPLGKEGQARAMVYPDASGVPSNMLPANDARAFDQIKQLVDSETPALADPDWMGMLAALGIEKGRPFAPDARTRKILDAAAATAYQMSRVLGTQSEINGVSYLVYPDRQWINPMASGNPFDMAWQRPTDGALAPDPRTNFVSFRQGCTS